MTKPAILQLCIRSGRSNGRILYSWAGMYEAQPGATFGSNPNAGRKDGRVYEE